MNRMKSCLLATTATLLLGAQAHANDVQHVLLLSVDGLHARDLARYTADPVNKDRALTRLATSGAVFPNAFTTAPSDSFPGMIAQVTGGTPRSAGVYYDDSYDRTLFAPTNTTCSGDAGAEILYAENIDRDPARLDVAVGGVLGDTLSQIDPANLPRALRDGQCVPVYPHEFIRVNTVFEVIREHGGRTAWADKHPAYEILNGPSGGGLSDLFTPEVDSVIPGTAPSKATATTTGSFAAIRGNDEVKVGAILNEIRGLDSTGKTQPGVPAMFGMNFQAVSVGQKLAASGPTDPPGLTGGYTDAAGTPGNALKLQLDYVDGAIGRMLDGLQQEGLDRNTLLIVSAKHGQSPIDPSLRRALDDTPYTLTPGYGFHIADDGGLLWLKPQTRSANIAAAKTYLLAQSDALGIAYLFTPAQIAGVYRNPAFDARAPDFIADSDQGVIYTGGTKLAEHGGLSDDDRNVALVVAGPGMKASVVSEEVFTTQIAPTILKALRLDPTDLQAVQIEHTKALPDIAE